MKIGMITRSLVAFMLTASLTTGCATVFSGTKCKVKVKEGNPVEAKVYLNGNYMGTAPCKVKIPKNSLKDGGLKLEIRAEGYQPQFVTLTRKVKVAAIVGDVVTGVVWLIVDFADGAIYKAYPSTIRYSLDKLPESEPRPVKEAETTPKTEE